MPGRWLHMSSEFGDCLFLIFMAMFANLLLYIDYEHRVFRTSKQQRKFSSHEAIVHHLLLQSQSGFRIGSLRLQGVIIFTRN